MKTNHTSFKRLPFGATFTTDEGKFRKVSKHGAFRIKTSGIGETHKQVPFTRSAAVTTQS